MSLIPTLLRPVGLPSTPERNGAARPDSMPQWCAALGAVTMAPLPDRMRPHGYEHTSAPRVVHLDGEPTYVGAVDRDGHFRNLGFGVHIGRVAVAEPDGVIVTLPDSILVASGGVYSGLVGSGQLDRFVFGASRARVVNTDLRMAPGIVVPRLETAHPTAPEVPALPERVAAVGAELIVIAGGSVDLAQPPSGVVGDAAEAAAMFLRALNTEARESAMTWHGAISNGRNPLASR